MHLTSPNRPLIPPLLKVCTVILSAFIFTLLITGEAAQAAPAEADRRANALVSAARAQIGVTRHYSGGYVKLTYPGGDLSPLTGVCTDVLIRAYRAAFGYDLQQSVHEDMKRNFSVYPKIWGLKQPDTNIDHRRVPNLQIYFTRQSAQRPVSNNPADYQPGSIVTQLIDGRLPHVVIVSDRRSADEKRPLVIHNIGSGTQEEDSLFAYPITGHYRYLP